MEKQSRLEQLKHCLKTRNLHEARALLVSNLIDFPEDKDFLMICYKLAKEDSLIFQKHNHELLDMDVENMNEEVYEDLIENMMRNFSQIRYDLGMQLSLYFYELKQKEAEAMIMEEKEGGVKKKKWRERVKFPKRIKKKRSDRERYTLAGIKMTGFLLICLVVELILDSTS